MASTQQVWFAGPVLTGQVADVACSTHSQDQADFASDSWLTQLMFDLKFDRRRDLTSPTDALLVQRLCESVDKTTVVKRKVFRLP